MTRPLSRFRPRRSRIKRRKRLVEQHLGLEGKEDRRLFPIEGAAEAKRAGFFSLAKAMSAGGGTPEK
jgi:hypothetical protein